MDDISSNSPDTPPLPYLLSVIIPIRNEEASLPACLESLLSQSEPAFELARQWELILVDDSSTDRTPEILAQAAAAYPGVSILHPGDPIPLGLTGKSNACWAGAQAAQGGLLLFTDADTIHTPGSLSRARHEYHKYYATLLSYSPRQLTTGFLQRITTPLIFAELAIAYPPAAVNDLTNPIAAANGQFLLVEGQAYFNAGGHRALGFNVLEDVALARNIKRSRGALRFRYAPDAVSTRMYRTLPAFFEGWTKNLALLFPNPFPLALLRLLDALLIFVIPFVAVLYPFPSSLPRILLAAVWIRVLVRFYVRTAKSNFPPFNIVLSVLGLKLFAILLIRSWFKVRLAKSVSWKGRTYRT